MERLLTLKEFCDLARISRASFYRLVNPPRTIRLTRKILISPSDAAAFIERMKRGEQ